MSPPDLRAGLEVELTTEVGALAIDASLAVAAEDCVAIAGRSGAGKSTILRAIAGLHEPRRGFIRVNGDVWLDTDAGTNWPIEARGCGFVFQHYALFPHLSARENVAYPLIGEHLSRRERLARADELLERFNLSALASRRAPSLSGGEQQRVALARALARNPDVLLLDEPLSALDPHTRSQARRELEEMLAETPVPTLLVTHSFEEAATLGSRIAVFDKGQIAQEGTATELAASPRSAFVADFTGAVTLTGESIIDENGLATVKLDGGGMALSTDAIAGRVTASVYPWEISLEPSGSLQHGSALNRLAVTVTSITEVGGRARIGLIGPQPMVAEVTVTSVNTLDLRPGSECIATWKATATRLSE